MGISSSSRAFIGGSRIGVASVKESPKIFETLDLLQKGKHQILVGDAAGSDKLVQDYLHKTGYQLVTVFHSTPEPRFISNSQWSTVDIGSKSGATGKALLELKDIEMAKQADIGFMIWDDFHKNRYGRWTVSSGTLLNIINLLTQEKTVAVFHVPTNTRIHFNDLQRFEDQFIQNRPEKDETDSIKNQLLVKTFKDLRRKAEKLFIPDARKKPLTEPIQFNFDA